VIQTTNTTLNGRYDVYKKDWYYVTCTRSKVSFWTTHPDPVKEEFLIFGMGGYHQLHNKDKPYRSYNGHGSTGFWQWDDSSGSDLSNSEDDDDDDDEDEDEMQEQNKKRRRNSSNSSSGSTNKGEKRESDGWEKKPEVVSPYCLASLEGEDYDEGTVLVGEKRGLSLYHVKKGRSVTKQALQGTLVRCMARLESVWIEGVHRRNVVVCGCDSAIVIFDVDSWTVLAEIRTPTPVDYYAVCEILTIPTPSPSTSFSSSSSSASSSSSSRSPTFVNSHTVLAGGTSNEVELWDWKTNTKLRGYVGHAGLITGIAEIRHNNTFASCAKDCCIIVWDRESGQRLRCWKGGKSFLRGLAAFEQPSPDDFLLISGSEDHMVRFWNLQGVCVDTCSPGVVKSLSLLKCGQVACALNGGSVKIYKTYRK